jgi:hypothetical protein
MRSRKPLHLASWSRVLPGHNKAYSDGRSADTLECCKPYKAATSKSPRAAVYQILIITQHVRAINQLGF